MEIAPNSRPGLTGKIVGKAVIPTISVTLIITNESPYLVLRYGEVFLVEGASVDVNLKEYYETSIIIPKELTIEPKF